MKLLQGLAQVLFIQVRIDFRGRNALVPHHLLHRPQVCPGLYEVRGERMPQGMRVYALFDTCLFLCLFKYCLNRSR